MCHKEHRGLRNRVIVQSTTLQLPNQSEATRRVLLMLFLNYDLLFVHAGISNKLDHLIDSNVDAFWLSPFYPSPMVDFGYDISNFVDVDRIYGTLEDFENLVQRAHAVNIKVIVDFVPNHSSDKHEWFQKSIKNIKPYSDYYIWSNGTVNENGTRYKPNNWVKKID